MTNRSKHGRREPRARRAAGAAESAVRGPLPADVAHGEGSGQTRGSAAGGAKCCLSVVVSGSPARMGPEIRRAALQAVQSQGYCHGRLEIAIVGEAEMRRQHKRWMGRATVTDVLSFDLREGGERELVDGQLVVCEAVARRVAGLHDTDWRGELLLYVIHGCLHLCGHDDHRAGEAARMHEEEDRLLSLLGWGPVFAGSSSEAPVRVRPARRRRRGRA
jgi:probable rRNA maturation factor